MSALVWVAVAAAGGAGALLRFFVDGAIAARAGRDLPVGTFVVNVTGAAALGVVTGLVLSTDAALVVGSGLLGSYTTFSTWMLESQRLTEEGRLAATLANAIVSLGAGLGAVALGRVIGGGG